MSLDDTPDTVLRTLHWGPETRKAEEELPLVAGVPTKRQPRPRRTTRAAVSAVALAEHRFKHDATVAASLRYTARMISSARRSRLGSSSSMAHAPSSAGGVVAWAPATSP